MRRRVARYVPRVKGLLAIVALVSLTTCAAKTPPPARVGPLVGPKPTSLLLIVTPAEFLGPHLPDTGGFTTTLEGLQYQRRYRLVDPSWYVGRQVSERFATRHALRLSVVKEAAPVEGQKGGRLPRTRPRRPSADLMLELRTVRWGIVSAPLALEYTAAARLTDDRSGRVLAENGCAEQPALAATDAASLQKAMATAAKHCIEGLTVALVPPLDAPAAPPPASDAGVLDAGLEAPDTADGGG
jgi:hypothetical protein